MKRLDAKLTQNRPEGADGCVLSFAIPLLDRPPLPGQFFMVKLMQSGFPLFGRALAVLAYHHDGGRATVDFLLKAVGQGTAMLRESREGDGAMLVGPAGNGFPPLETDKRYLLVAGGTGMAAFRLVLDLIASGAAQKPADLVVLYGGRSRDTLYLHDALSRYDVELRCSTEDGSLGTKGLVTELLEEALDGFSGDEGSSSETVVYTCGPDAMMQAVNRLCLEREVTAYLSLETRMACGIGVCNGCAVEVVLNGEKSFERVCHEGPVYPGIVLPHFC